MNNEERILEMLERLTVDVSGLKQDVSGLKQDVSTLKEKVEELDARSLRSAVALEGTVIPRLQLLYEGHETIIQGMDRLTPNDQFEALESDVSVIKTTVQSHSQRLTALEQAG